MPISGTSIDSSVRRPKTTYFYKDTSSGDSSVVTTEPTVHSQPPTALSPIYGSQTSTAATGPQRDKRSDCAVTPKATLHRPHDLGERISVPGYRIRIT